MKKETLWLIWHLPSANRYKIGQLNFTGKNFEFYYINKELAAAQASGFTTFPGFPETQKTYHSQQLFANIATRLPNPKRPDYLDFLNKYGLSLNSSQFDILKATRGRLLTDTFEFVPPFNDAKIEFDVAGTSHRKHSFESLSDKVHLNSPLSLEHEPDNKFDPNAVKVILNDSGQTYHLGYVPRYYSADLTKYLKHGYRYSAIVKKISPFSEIKDENMTVSVSLILDNRETHHQS